MTTHRFHWFGSRVRPVTRKRKPKSKPPAPKRRAVIIDWKARAAGDAD